MERASWDGGTMTSLYQIAVYLFKRFSTKWRVRVVKPAGRSYFTRDWEVSKVGCKETGTLQTIVVNEWCRHERGNLRGHPKSLGWSSFMSWHMAWVCPVKCSSPVSQANHYLRERPLLTIIIYWALAIG